jgi:hypothetical protein
LSWSLPSAAGWPAAWLLGACSVLVGSEPEPLRCSDEGQVGPPACDEGQVCSVGICRSAQSSSSSSGEAGTQPEAGGDATAGAGLTGVGGALPGN